MTFVALPVAWVVGAADTDGWSGTERFPAAEGNGASDVSHIIPPWSLLKYSTITSTNYADFCASESRDLRWGVLWMSSGRRARAIGGFKGGLSTEYAILNAR